jgi:hypothetical protein
MRKDLDYETLRPKYSGALKRAEDLERWHALRDTVGANPSTTVYKLVDQDPGVTLLTRRAAP